MLVIGKVTVNKPGQQTGAEKKAVGYVGIGRCLLESVIFKNEKLLKVFVWCCLKATHTEYIQQVGKQQVKLSPGQFVFGRESAARELGMAETTVYKKINELERNSYLVIKRNNKFSLVTVANEELFDPAPVIGRSKRSSKRNTNSNIYNINTPYGSIDDKSIDKDGNAYKCAIYLSNSISERIPERKKATEKILQNWAVDFDKTNRLDGYDWDLIADVLAWSQDDTFWQNNILSGATFRKQFDKLLVKMRAGEGRRR